MADSLEGRLVAEAVLATLHNESEARVDVLGGLFLFKRSEKDIEINGWYILLVGSSDHYEENRTYWQEQKNEPRSASIACFPQSYWPVEAYDGGGWVGIFARAVR